MCADKSNKKAKIFYTIYRDLEDEDPDKQL